MSDNGFEDVKILNNFYQTSSFFPMPVVLVSTVAESGQTNLGPYSLCFPYRIAGEQTQAMKLITRSNSNTAINIQRTGICAINFIEDDKKYLENCVVLGFPGETTEEKMMNSIFTLIPSTRLNGEMNPNIKYPEIVKEAFQIYECKVDSNHPIEVDEDTGECHMVLRIEKIILKKKWKQALIEGKGFPRVPVDYGFRNNAYFWFSKHSKPYKVPIPESKAVDISSIKFAVERIDPEIIWTDEACEKIVKVPRVFLSQVIRGVNDKAREKGITEITADFMDEVRDKRSDEKGK
ncbi:MAG TPA: PCP reductase family protein [candidate division Zixibacteria bacterium]|nr:PCP reductase family protein [candidate division Zixibacteria bacterium]